LNSTNGVVFRIFVRDLIGDLTMVRLITHNLLACHAKGCNANNFPLRFQNVQLEIREAEFNPDFLRAFLPKLEWQALVNTAREV
jgi:multifunctional methyltransferase subunit TRM112